MFCRLTACAAFLATSAFAQSTNPVAQGAPNFAAAEPAFPQQTRAPAMDSGTRFQIERLATGLAHPWGIAVLPEGGYLITERDGRLRYLDAEGLLHPPLTGLPDILVERQGGLLDVALSPDFAQSRVIYLSYSKPMGGGRSVTAAARGVLSADLSGLEEVEDIFVQTPPSPSAMHYGSRVIPSGPHVYVTTGEHSRPAERVLAQDLGTTYGRVVRVLPDGRVPADNPFVGQEGARPESWTYGQRNIQGAALRDDGTLWTVEHGPRGGDELNLITPGANYGWPVVSYGINYNGSEVGSGAFAHAPNGFTEPRYYWDPVIAPGGMIFYDGDLFPAFEGNLLIGSLNPGALVRLELDGDVVVGEERLLTDIGRVRDVEQDADGALLVLIDANNGAVLRLTPQR